MGHGFVLDRRRHNVTTLLRQRACGAEHGQIVGFGAPARENDLGRRRVHERRNLRARFLREIESTSRLDHPAIVKILESEDQMEVVIMQDQLLVDLAKPIPAGRRNNTLFAIGQQLKLAQIPNWETHLYNRAMAVGLAQDECDKLVANVGKYN